MSYVLKIKSSQNFSVLSGAGMENQNTNELLDINQDYFALTETETHLQTNRPYLVLKCQFIEYRAA